MLVSCWKLFIFLNKNVRYNTVLLIHSHTVYNQAPGAEASVEAVDLATIYIGAKSGKWSTMIIAKKYRNFEVQWLLRGSFATIYIGAKSGKWSTMIIAKKYRNFEVQWLLRGSFAALFSLLQLPIASAELTTK